MCGGGGAEVSYRVDIVGRSQLATPTLATDRGVRGKHSVAADPELSASPRTRLHLETRDLRAVYGFLQTLKQTHPLHLHPAEAGTPPEPPHWGGNTFCPTEELQTQAAEMLPALYTFIMTVVPKQLLLLLPRQRVTSSGGYKYCRYSWIRGVRLS